MCGTIKSQGQRQGTSDIKREISIKAPFVVYKLHSVLLWLLSPMVAVAVASEVRCSSVQWGGRKKGGV